MTQELLEDYVRLLTVDTRACADLFARDAIFQTQLGSQELYLRGRQEIERFLKHVPRQILFRASDLRSEGDGWLGEILILPDGLPPRRQRVRYSVESGRFASFHWLPGG